MTETRLRVDVVYKGEIEMMSLQELALIRLKLKEQVRIINHFIFIHPDKTKEMAKGGE